MWTLRGVFLKALALYTSAHLRVCVSVVRGLTARRRVHAHVLRLLKGSSKRV